MPETPTTDDDRPTLATLPVKLRAEVLDALKMSADRQSLDVAALAAQVLTEYAIPFLSELRAAAGDASGNQAAIVARRLELLMGWRKAVRNRPRGKTVRQATWSYVHQLRQQGEKISGSTLQHWDLCFRVGVHLTDKRGRKGDPFYAILLDVWQSGRHRTVSGAWWEACQRATAEKVRLRSCRSAENYLRPFRSTNPAALLPGGTAPV